MYPRGLDLEAEVLEALHGELHGVASALSGCHSADNFRERLRGERSFPLSDLCRLATDPTREARAAALAAVRLLARALGHSLDVTRAGQGTIAARASDAAAAATELLGAVARAQEDGRIDVDEREALRPRVAALRRTAAACDAAIEQVGPGGLS